jgi:RNA polymerase sigma factor (sigma-70 family)
LVVGFVPEGSVEEEGLVGLYQAQYARLVALAWLLVGSTPAAEDVVQESFIGIGSAWSRVDDPVAYLRTTVINGCRKAQRRAGRERIGLPFHHGSWTVDDDRDELLEVLDRLTAAQRAAVVMRYYLDLPTGEIAEVLGCREGTVRSHLRRGLAKLKDVLDDTESD